MRPPSKTKYLARILERRSSQLTALGRRWEDFCGRSGVDGRVLEGRLPMGIASPVRLIWRPVPEPGEDSNASLRVDAHRTLASLAPRASRERQGHNHDHHLQRDDPRPCAVNAPFATSSERTDANSNFSRSAPSSLANGCATATAVPGVQPDRSRDWTPKRGR